MKKLLPFLLGGAIACGMMPIALAETTLSPPAHEEQQSVTIVASLLSATDLSSSDQGLYSFSLQNPAQRTLLLQGPVASYGGVAIDGIYYCNTKTSWLGMFNFYDVYGYDLTTGSQVMDYDGEDATAYFSQGGMSLDPITGDAIGVFYDSEMLSRQLAIVSYGVDAPRKSVLAELSDPDLVISAFAVDGAGGCWAISSEGSLYSIDRSSGQCAVVGPTGFVPQAVGGAVIDPDSNKMYWALSPADGSGRLIEVDLATGAGTQITTFEDNAQWNGLYIPRPEADDLAPARCSDFTINFPDGAMAGSISFSAPTALYNGYEGSGELFVSAFVNGELISKIPAVWGEQISMPVDLASHEPGWFDFMIMPSNAAGNGPRSKIKHVWIGSDTPAAPAPVLSYDDGVMSLSWDPVNIGINEGYVNPGNVRYSVYDKDSTLVAGNIADTDLQIAVTPPPAESARSYFYLVKASVGELSSSLAKSNTVALGAVKPPFTADFSKSGLDAFTIIDANCDGIEWSLDNESPVGISIHYSPDLDMDDWLISPPLDLKAGSAYAVSFMTYSMESYYAERIEVKWGDDNTADAMSQTILPPTLLPNMKNDPLCVTKYICPETDGRYFIGFHGISDKDKFDLILEEFSVAAPVSVSVPAKCTQIKAESLTLGTTLAAVSCRAPQLTIDGKALNSPLKIDVYRNDVLAKSFNNVQPGADLSFEDNTGQSGNFIYRFVPSNSYGSGEEDSVSVYVGYHQPAAPAYADIARTDTEGEVSLSWAAVSRDVDDVEFPAGAVVYDVYSLTANKAVVLGLQENSYTFRAVLPGKQEMLAYEIRARYGELAGEGTKTTSIPVGTPYNGLWETGDYGEYIWGISSAGGADWSLMNDSGDGMPDSFDGDGSYFGCTGSEAGDFGVLFSGLVSIDDIANPALTFATYHIPGTAGTTDRNKIMVSVKKADSEEWIDIWTKDVAEVAPVPGEWGMATVPLSSFIGNVIQVQFSATCVSYPLTLIDGIRISEGSACNLAVSGIKAPLRVMTGTDYNVQVSVENIGAVSSGEFGIHLFVDDVEVASRACAEIPSLASTSESFTLRMSAVAESDVIIRAEITCPDDEVSSDNVSPSITVAPANPGLPVPVALSGSIDRGSVSLHWTKPDLNATAGQPVTDDFEDAASFADSYGNWTFVDVDKSPVGGLSGTDIPGIISGATLGSFWIWDTDQLPIGGNGVAHSGSKYLFSLFRYNNQQSDDWAISPELSGDEQTISFWAKSYSGSYPEHLQVLVSAESSNTADFVLLENGDLPNLANVWTKYEFVVPAGTKYFALRNCAAGAFMLMIDDVTYIPASRGDLSLAGYNVYRNGQLLNSSPIADTEWKDSGLEKDKNYIYQVTAIYTNVGESAPSNKVTSTGDGAGISDTEIAKVKATVRDNTILLSNPEGVQVTIHNAAGISFYSGAHQGTFSIPVPAGTYIVRTPGATIKLLVP